MPLFAKYNGYALKNIMNLIPRMCDTQFILSITHATLIDIFIHLFMYL